jgi:hypothetical protein
MSHAEYCLSAPSSTILASPSASRPPVGVLLQQVWSPLVALKSMAQPLMCLLVVELASQANFQPMNVHVAVPADAPASTLQDQRL